VPPNHDTPGCIDKSAAGAGWDIGNITWFIKGAWEFILRFDVINLANNYTISCGGRLVNLTPLYFGPDFPEWFNQEFMGMRDTWKTFLYCEDRLQQPTRGHLHPVMTLYSTWSVHTSWYDFWLQQTWYCDDKGPETPQKFTSVGNVNLTSWSCIDTSPSDPFALRQYNCTHPPSTFPAVPTLPQQTRQLPFRQTP
jgi:hypothetical protein